MGGLRDAGLVGSIVGALAIAVGTIIAPGAGTAAGAAFASTLQTAGVIVAVASSIAVALDPLKAPEADRGRNRRRFGFDGVNIAGDDVPIPILYGRRRVAPIFTQAYITPVDEAGELVQGAGAVASKSNALTLQGVVSEGPLPVDWLEKVWVNDQLLFEDVSLEGMGSGDGTQTKFTFPRRYIDLSTLKLFVDAVQQTAVESRSRSGVTIGKGNGTKKKFEHKEDANNARIDFDTISLSYWQEEVGGGQTATGTGPTVPGAEQSYKVEALNNSKFRVKFVNAVPKGVEIKATYKYTAAEEGIRINEGDGGEVKVIFLTPPANAAKLTWSGRVSNFPNVSIETRRGEVDQAPIKGMNKVRNTYDEGSELATGQAITYATRQTADDVTVTISALNGMIRHRTGADSGQTSPVSALITVDYRVTGTTKWTSLPVPSGGTEFKLKGETDAVKRWEIGIRATLKAAVEKGRTGAQDALDAFTRAKYDVRLVRTDVSRQGAAGTNRDKLWFQYATETLDEELSYPGTAYILLRGVAAEKLQGSLPNLQIQAKGREVKNLQAGTTAWSDNPAWCVADMLTNTRYGASVSESDLITADWTLWASFCDASVKLDDGTTEKRCLLDASLEQAQHPLSWAVNLAFPAFAVPVLKGKKWGVFIDKARTTDKTYEYTGATSNTAFESLTTGIETREKSPTEIEVQFSDRDEEFERGVVLIVPSTRADPRIKKAIDLPGCTRRTQAIRVGTHVLESTRLQRYVVEFEAMPDGALSEAGDVILVKSEIGAWTAGKKFRVLRVSFDRTLRVRLVCREYSDELYGQLPQGNPASRSATPVVNDKSSGTAAKGLSTAGRRRRARFRPSVRVRERRWEVSS